MIHRLKLLLGVLLLIFIIVILYFCKKSNLEVVKTINQNEDYIVYEHPEDWRINDINTYAYMIHDILNPFNDDILEEGLWITDNFKKKCENGEFSLRVSINSDIFNEWYRTNIETGEDTSLVDNTQQNLDKGNIIIYTEIHGASILQEKKYTLKFTVDRDNKLDNLEIVNTDIIKDYNIIGMELNKVLYDLIKDYYNDKTMLNKYSSSFLNGFDYNSALNDLNISKFSIDNIILRESTSELYRAVFYAKDSLVNDKYYGFSITYNTDDSGLINKISSDWFAEIDSSRYYSDDIKESVEW